MDRTSKYTISVVLRRMLNSLILIGTICSVYGQTKIPLEKYFRGLRSVEVEVAGESYNFLFDTAAGLTMISPEIAERLGKTAYGNSVGFRMNGERVDTQLCDGVGMQIGGVEIPPATMAVFDIMSLLPPEFKRIDGIISLGSFEGQRITLDMAADRIIVETEESFNRQIKTMKQIPSRFVNGTSGDELNLLLGVRAASRDCWFLFDSGNIADVILSESVAAVCGLEHSGSEDNEPRSAELALGALTFGMPVMVEDIIYEGVMNFELIKQLVVSISLPDRRVWLRRAGSETAKAMMNKI